MLVFFPKVKFDFSIFILSVCAAVLWRCCTLNNTTQTVAGGEENAEQGRRALGKRGLGGRAKGTRVIRSLAPPARRADEKT